MCGQGHQPFELSSSGAHSAGESQHDVGNIKSGLPEMLARGGVCPGCAINAEVSCLY